jgi:hypothetical protein
MPGLYGWDSHHELFETEKEALNYAQQQVKLRGTKKVSVYLAVNPETWKRNGSWKTIKNFNPPKQQKKAGAPVSSKAKVIAKLVEAGHEDLAEQLVAAIKETQFTPEEQKERELVQKDASVRLHKQNPYVGKSFSDFVICFRTLAQDSEPLYWVGDGFKNMAKVRSDPQYFKTKADAEKKIRSEVLDFIRKWRTDQTHLIIGW